MNDDGDVVRLLDHGHTYCGSMVPEEVARCIIRELSEKGHKAMAAKVRRRLALYNRHVKALPPDQQDWSRPGSAACNMAFSFGLWFRKERDKAKAAAENRV